MNGGEQKAIDDLPAGSMKYISLFLRLNIWQMLVLVLLSMLVFFIAKDLGIIPDRKMVQLEIVTQYLEGNSVALQRLLKITEQHSSNTETIADSAKQISRYLCWMSKIPESEKHMLCTK